eukprot:8800560-Pyramimonas_sp.AAC.1
MSLGPAQAATSLAATKAPPPHLQQRRTAPKPQPALRGAAAEAPQWPPAPPIEGTSQPTMHQA